MSGPRDKRKHEDNDDESVGIEVGSDGVDAVIGLGNGMSIDTDGEVGIRLGGGITMEMDGDLRIGGFNLFGD
jgi:hypothetical protein